MCTRHQCSSAKEHSKLGVGQALEAILEYFRRMEEGSRFVELNFRTFEVRGRIALPSEHTRYQYARQNVAGGVRGVGDEC